MDNLPATTQAPTTWETALRTTRVTPPATKQRAEPQCKPSELPSEPLLQLNPAASLLFRSRVDIQFGLDTTRTAVVTFPTQACATSTVTFLASTRQPASRQDIINGLTRCGNKKETAYALVEDLIAFRVLVPTSPPVEMALVGSGGLATAVQELMPADIIHLRTSGPSETDSRFLARVPAGIPIILLDALVEAPTHTLVLSKKTNTIVQGYVLDGRGFAGPIMVDGDGPCPLCVELYRIDRDPRWRMLVAQSLVRKGARDPLILASTAAHIVALSLRAAGIRVAQPGAGNFFHDPPSPAIPGEFVVVDPYSLTLTHEVMKPHPHCPACFERINGTRLGPPAVPPRISPA